MRTTSPKDATVRAEELRRWAEGHARRPAWCFVSRIVRDRADAQYIVAHGYLPSVVQFYITEAR